MLLPCYSSPGVDAQRGLCGICCIKHACTQSIKWGFWGEMAKTGPASGLMLAIINNSVDMLQTQEWG